MAINNWNKQNIQTDKSEINKNTEKNDYKIIIDKPAENASDLKEHSERLSQIIIKSIPQFTVGIFGGWGTGKTTMMQMIKDEIDTNYSDVATTIWFDSWRYEREEYSLMIPLLRTIIVTLHNVIIKLTDDKKKQILRNLQTGFIKTIKAVARGTSANLGGELGGKVSAGLSLDFGQILDEYESDGHINYDQKRISLHKHVSDYLKEELDNIKNKHRLVIFIDDLDRCTPEKALEILESVKTFFDIEGIIYVIGMDPSTIDPIINVKYGESSRISGLDYLQKIVQLPFQIPVWSDENLGKTIKEMANETGLPKDVTDKLSQEKIKDLIINSAKLNPRNIKRFINSLVISYNTTDKNIKDISNENLRNYIIDNYLESMISLQTFYFRGEKWLQFLKMINNYTDRVEFLTHFILFVVNKNISLQELQDKIKDFSSQEYRKPNKKTLEIYNELIEINDEDFFTFLLKAAIPLLRIDNIENYLRIVDTTKDIDTTENRKIKSYECLDELKNGIESFNQYVQGYVVHLPYLELNKIRDKLELDLSKANLSKANLSLANLSKANLTLADLSKANLTGADLTGANLTDANLSLADLTGADLTGADLTGANLFPLAKLSGANLINANLTGANLSLRANLTDANLANADLSKADLTGAKLSGAYLLHAKLTGANLSDANLSDANLSLANLTGANLSDANLSDANLSFANLSFANLRRANLPGADLTDAGISNSIIIGPQNYESIKLNENTNFNNAITDNIEFIYHTSKFTEDIPNFANNKKQLKTILENMPVQLNKHDLELILLTSNLPEE